MNQSAISADVVGSQLMSQISVAFHVDRLALKIANFTIDDTHLNGKEVLPRAAFYNSDQCSKLLLSYSLGQFNDL